MKIYELKFSRQFVAEVQAESVTKPEAIVKYMDGAFDEHPNQEHFFAIGLNGNNEPIFRYLCTLGLVNQTQAHPREAFRACVQASAVSVIFVHNHPSGTLKASPEDMAMTKNLVEAGKILGIPVLDHIIISDDGFNSIRGISPEIFK